MREHLATIIPELASLSAALKNNKINERFFRETFLELGLENLFHEHKPYDMLTTSEKAKISDIFKDTTLQLKRYYNRFVCAREFELAQTIVASRKPQIEDLECVFALHKSIRHTARAKGAKVAAKDKVLFIGSGSVPATAIFLSMNARCRVDCIEQSKRYASISKKIIKKFGLSNKINVYNQKGQSITKGLYDVILIALFAEPKEEILKNLKGIVYPHTRIICRTVVGIRALLYGRADSGLFDGFEIIKKKVTKDKSYYIYHLRLAQ